MVHHGCHCRAGVRMPRAARRDHARHREAAQGGLTGGDGCTEVRARRRQDRGGVWQRGRGERRYSPRGGAPGPRTGDLHGGGVYPGANQRRRLEAAAETQRIGRSLSLTLRQRARPGRKHGHCRRAGGSNLHRGRLRFRAHRHGLEAAAETHRGRRQETALLRSGRGGVRGPRPGGRQGGRGPGGQCGGRVPVQAHGQRLGPVPEDHGLRRRALGRIRRHTRHGRCNLHRRGGQPDLAGPGIPRAGLCLRPQRHHLEAAGPDHRSGGRPPEPQRGFAVPEQGHAAVRSRAGGRRRGLHLLPRGHILESEGQAHCP